MLSPELALVCRYVQRESRVTVSLTSKHGPDTVLEVCACGTAWWRLTAFEEECHVLYVWVIVTKEHDVTEVFPVVLDAAFPIVDHWIEVRPLGPEHRQIKKRNALGGIMRCGFEHDQIR